MSWKRLIFVCIIAFGAYSYFNKTSNQQYIAGQPTQSGVVEMNGYLIKPLEPFKLHARVLSSKQYLRGRESDLVPVDLALGWGPMADLSITNQITVTQSNRWYHWRVKTFPIPRREIETHSANMHLIPATPEIAAAIKAAQTGQMVQFVGELVNVSSQDGRWHWKSSLTRNDTGAGACELVLVKSFTLL